MIKIKDYVAANLLSLNPDKSQIMLISKNKKLKDKFKIDLNGKLVKDSKEIKPLGITLDKNIMWDTHIKKNLIPQLLNKVRTFRKISRYLSQKFKHMYANYIYRSKLLYGIESWGGAQLTNISTLQRIQDRMTKYVFGEEKKHSFGLSETTIIKMAPNQAQNITSNAQNDIQTNKFGQTGGIGISHAPEREITPN